MREKLNKKEQHNLYTLFTRGIYSATQVKLLEKQINSSTIAYLLIYSAFNITYLNGHSQRLTHYYSASNTNNKYKIHQHHIRPNVKAIIT